MADNDAPTKAVQGKAKQADKPTHVGGKVVLVTKTFDPYQPILLDQAAEAFKKQTLETYGEGTQLTNVAVTVAKHKAGNSVTYDVTGEIG